jgi:hypothetical protein
MRDLLLLLLSVAVVGLVYRKDNVKLKILVPSGVGVFLVLRFVVLPFLSKEYFDYMPDSRVVPPCPPGSERGDKNGMDCKSMGDKHGI